MDHSGEGKHDSIEKKQCRLRLESLASLGRTNVSRFRSHCSSISRLKLRRYLSTRFETAPPKLEVSLNVIRVMRS